ncbi:C40 family peptidase [Geotalea sp. SG265]|uniref:C40 family peptidase n=1 Tax=Geotalea sp. SG265 TaxID=2922867 RepID=UPI001FB01A64|nr:C40 family peptidase [Geotalea sp. SG265]
MSVLRRLLLLFSLFLFFSFLIVVSNSEAARIKAKKVETLNKSTAGAVAKKQPSIGVSRRDTRNRALPLAEEYLESELEPSENAVLQKAFGLLGIKYRFGGSSYAGIDCSAFVKKVFASLSLPLPRTAREQYAIGRDVPPGDLQKGDLLFYRTYAGFPSHVGIYIGNDLMIHASSEGGRVTISRIDTPYFLSRFLGARRIPSDGRENLWELADVETLIKELVNV